MTWYTVYDARTDAVLAIGPAKACAQALGVTEGAFRGYLSYLNAGKKCYLAILAEELDDEGNVVSAQVYENPSGKKGPPLGFDEGEALRLYDLGYNDRENAEALGTSQVCVSGWRRRRGLPANGRRGRKKGAAE